MSGELTPTDWGTELHVFCGFVSILSGVGTFGNVLILLVYRKQCDKRATNVFIRVLAVLDLLVCLVVMPYTIIFEYKLMTAQFACKLCELTRHFNIIMSNFTLVAVAVERYLAICRPTLTVLASDIKKVVALMVVISTVLSTPSMWIFAVVPGTSMEHAAVSNFTNSITEYVTTDGPSYCQFINTLLGPTLTLVYQGTTALLCFTGVTAIIVLYVFVYRLVWNRDKVRKKNRISPSVWITDNNHPVDETAGVVNAEPNQKVRVAFNMNVSKPEQSKSQVENDEKSAVSDCVKQSQNTSQTIAPVINVPRRERNVHRKTGTMLFLCTLVIILSWMPFWLDIFGVSHSLVFRHMFFISNASNPIIYSIVNKQVRIAMAKTVCRKKQFPGHL